MEVAFVQGKFFVQDHVADEVAIIAAHNVRIGCAHEWMGIVWRFSYSGCTKGVD
jgi:hypothetical protein